LPASLTKNGREHTFPVGQLTLDILAPLRERRGYLFPAMGTRGERPFAGWSKSKPKLDTLSGVEDWTLHDIRRTFATNLAALGTPIHVTEKLLNHISGTTGGLVGVYQRHRFWDEQIEAIKGWEARLSQILREG
jgi:integrase